MRSPAAVAVVLLAAAAAQAQPAPPKPTRFTVELDDPMLAPLPPAATELGSWQEARRLIAGNATAIRRAEAAEARATARVELATSALRPTARATGEVALDLLHPGTAPGIPATPAATPTSPLGTLALGASLPLVDVGAHRGRDAARIERRAAVAGRGDAERRTALAVARAMIEVAAAGRAAELNRLGLRQALERAALARRTFELGAATELDTVRTEQDVALARAALVAGDERVRRAREALGLALGVDRDVGVRAELAGPALLVELAAHCPALPAGVARADVEAAQAAVEAARARRAQARAGALPTVDLTTDLFAYTADPAPGRIPSWTVGVVLSVPLWEGGQRAAAVAEQAAAEADARAVVEDVRRGATVEMARARRGEEVAGTLVATAAEARALAERVDAMTRRSFEIGRATSLELVQSAAALRQAELTLSLREFERLQAQVDALLTEARCVP